MIHTSQLCWDFCHKPLPGPLLNNQVAILFSQGAIHNDFGGQTSSNLFCFFVMEKWDLNKSRVSVNRKFEMVVCWHSNLSFIGVTRINKPALLVQCHRKTRLGPRSPGTVGCTVHRSCQVVVPDAGDLWRKWTLKTETKKISWTAAGWWCHMCELGLWSPNWFPVVGYGHQHNTVLCNDYKAGFLLKVGWPSPV